MPGDEIEPTRPKTMTSDEPETPEDDEIPDEVIMQALTEGVLDYSLSTMLPQYNLLESIRKEFADDFKMD